jgi:hypothetical protein
MPDGFGGLLTTQPCDANNPLAIVHTQGFWEFVIAPSSGVACPAGLPKTAIRQDGAVVVAMPLQVPNPLQVLDGQSGNVVSAPAIPPSTFTNTFGQSTSCDCFTRVGQPMVDSDGSTYVEYNARQATSNVTTSAILALMKIAPDGTTSTTQLTSSSSGNDGRYGPVPSSRTAWAAFWPPGSLALPREVTCRDPIPTGPPT